ncbi:MAG: D-alanyl-D-alanine carboxypeptidase, partial [Tepidiformaceae bacterium]
MELRLILRRMITFVLLVSLVPSAAGSVLERNIGSRIERSDLRNAFWAVHVEDDQGRVIYSKNGDRLVVPASVRKLFSATTVADCRGLEHRYQTELWLDGEIENGVLHGNLIIRGAGDPSFGSRYEPRTTAIFDPWVAAVRAAGITVVNGGVVADVSLFDDTYYPGSWKYDNIGESYAPAIDALAFNENGVGVFMTAHGCERYWVATDPWFVPVLAQTNCADPRLSMKMGEENVLHVTGNPGRSTYGKLFTTLKSMTDPALYAGQAFNAALEDGGIRTVAEPRTTKVPIPAVRK